MPSRRIGKHDPARPARPDATNHRELLSSVVLLVLALALGYSNSFQGEFIFDDEPSIRRNASIQKLWPLTAALWPGVDRGRTVDGRPLLNLSLAINYAISGLNVWSYHAVNLLIHLAATLALFGLARQTFLLPKLRARFQPYATGLACAIALLWGLHPLQTESVTYIVQRAESLVGLFYLATLYAVARGETSRRPAAWWTGAFLCCLAGMATKEVMVTAPVVTALYLRAFVFDSWRETIQQRGRLLAALASTWILLIALVLAHGGRGGSVDIDAPLSPIQYATFQLAAIVHYLKLSIWPRPLVLDYGKQIEATPAQLAICALVLLILVAATLWALFRRPALGFLGAAFFIILAPSSSVVPVITQVMAEHRMYLPLAAIVSLAVVLGFLAWQRSSGRAHGPRRYLPVIVTAVVALSLGLQTWLRNLDYRTAISIWADTAGKQPDNPRAHSQLSLLYLEAQDIERSLAHVDRTIELTPTDAGPYFFRGVLHLQLKNYEAAAHDFSNCLMLNPDYAEAYQNRGLAWLSLHEYQRAVDDLAKAMQLGPQLVGSYRYRALAYSGLDRVAEAQADAREYLRRGGKPDESLQKLLSGDPPH